MFTPDKVEDKLTVLLSERTLVTELRTEDHDSRPVCEAGGINVGRRRSLDDGAVRTKSEGHDENYIQETLLMSACKFIL